LTPHFKPIFGRISDWITVGVLTAVSVAVAAQIPVQTPAQTNAPAQPQRVAPASRFVVVLDAAHGGDDGGGQVGGSVAEKTVTLELSVRLRSLLAARGFWVVTTREGNLNLDSDARAQIANHATAGAGASACLSLHASEAGTGVHIFVSSLEPVAATRFLAWKTAQSAYVSRSLKLAGTVNSALEQSADGGEANAGPIPATLARASLPGLDSMTCPALAIEMAPLRDADRKIVTDVTDSEYQAKVAQALAAALLEWRSDAAPDSRPDSRPDAHGGTQP
jgi:N-acetylmuramoyl-L-alanine amidase